MTIFFTSDPHFDHTNIITHCSRPFSNVKEMNEALVENYKKRVKPGDQVYILGDFAFNNHEKWARTLPGQKHLIVGNHDAKIRQKYLQWGFNWVKDTHEMRLFHDGNKFSIWLAHYAHITWPKKHYGAWHLFGHSHGKIAGKGFSTDVGVDCWNYAPVSLEELGEHFKNKLVTPEEQTAYGEEDSNEL